MVVDGAVQEIVRCQVVNSYQHVGRCSAYICTVQQYFSSVVLFEPEDKDSTLIQTVS
jgi:hypothetical protein